MLGLFAAFCARTKLDVRLDEPPAPPGTPGVVRFGALYKTGVGEVEVPASAVYFGKDPPDLVKAVYAAAVMEGAIAQHYVHVTMTDVAEAIAKFVEPRDAALAAEIRAGAWQAKPPRPEGQASNDLPEAAGEIAEAK